MPRGPARGDSVDFDPDEAFEAHEVQVRGGRGLVEGPEGGLRVERAFDARRVAGRAARDGLVEPGSDKGASMSLQRVSLAMKCVTERVLSSRTRREMISRPKMSRNE